MSVYVGIDVHRKRSQVAVIDAGGEVPANRNGAEPILRVIGGLPPGTRAAFEAAFGPGWLEELLEDSLPSYYPRAAGRLMFTWDNLWPAAQCAIG